MDDSRVLSFLVSIRATFKDLQANPSELVEWNWKPKIVKLSREINKMKTKNE